MADNIYNQLGYTGIGGQISSTPQTPSVGGYSSEQYGPVYVTQSGTPVASAEVPSYQQNLPYPNTTQTTTTNTGGGGGGFNPADENKTWFTNEFGQQQLIGQPVGDPFAGYDVDSMFAEAQKAFDLAEQASQSSYQSGLAEAGTTAEQQKQQLRADEQAKLGEYGEQRGRETTRKESVINQARRMASELSQGIQSKFGGTTGTGRFMSELVGREAVGNIGENTRLWQEAMTKITGAENSLKQQVTQMTNDVDTWLADTKLKLRAQLDQTLANIAGQRGATASEIAQTKLNALLDYQKYLQQLEMDNTNYRREMFAYAQQKQDQINRLKSTANQQISFNQLAPEFKTIQAGNQVYQAYPTPGYSPDAPGKIVYGQGTMSNDEETANPFN